eukprot:g38122.t1
MISTWKATGSKDIETSPTAKSKPHTILIWKYVAVPSLSLEATKVIIWSRVPTAEQDETHSCFFLQNVHRESSVISSLKEEDGSVMSSQSDTLRIRKSFYPRLYDMKPTDSTASQSFLSSVTEVIDNSVWERLDQPLCLDEVTKALKSLEKNKTPRSYCLQAELYSALWDLIGQDLLEVYNSMLLAGRTVSERLVLLRETIACRTGLDTCRLSLDQEKAFDRILHIYILMSIYDQLEPASGAKNNELTQTECCRLAHSKVQDSVLRDTLKLGAVAVRKDYCLKSLFKKFSGGSFRYRTLMVPQMRKQSTTEQKEQ